MAELGKIPLLSRMLGVQGWQAGMKWSRKKILVDRELSAFFAQPWSVHWLYSMFFGLCKWHRRSGLSNACLVETLSKEEEHSWTCVFGFCTAFWTKTDFSYHFQILILNTRRNYFPAPVISLMPCDKVLAKDIRELIRVTCMPGHRTSQVNSLCSVFSSLRNH